MAALTAVRGIGLCRIDADRDIHLVEDRCG
jgi:hypothetical protein